MQAAVTAPTHLKLKGAYRSFARWEAAEEFKVYEQWLCDQGGFDQWLEVNEDEFRKEFEESAAYEDESDEWEYRNPVATMSRRQYAEHLNGNDESEFEESEFELDRCWECVLHGAPGDMSCYCKTVYAQHAIGNSWYGSLNGSTDECCVDPEDDEIPFRRVHPEDPWAQEWQDDFSEFGKMQEFMQI